MSEKKKLNAEQIKNDAQDDALSEKLNVGFVSANNDTEPKMKMAKIELPRSPTEELLLRHEYTLPEFAQLLNKQWNGIDTNDFVCAESGASIYKEPFQICLLPNFLQNQQSCKDLVEEITEKTHWSRKQMDLYEFYQSTDLSNMLHCKLLTNFLQMLRREVCPWLEKVTNLKLDYVSASCSMYTCGDYLLVHDDLLKDRQIAFVYYLSPWKGVEEWSEAQGGCLELFNSDEHCLPQFPVHRKISPKHNQFLFFKVGSRSFHQVGEVTNFDYPRLTINGWFHGASNHDCSVDIIRPIISTEFKTPTPQGNVLNLLLNEEYLKQETRKAIQRRIEDNSEICLYEFIRKEVFDEALAQLRTDATINWRRQGPANAHNYDILDVDSTSGALSKLISLFGSAEMFSLLRDYTDLDLAGPNAEAPSFTLELQKWTHGSYTVLGDSVMSEDNTLDLIFYLNASDGAGVITYLSPEAEELQPDPELNGEEDESVLLTITPVDNSLNIVYRCEGTTKFVKYVSRNTPLDNGPVFIISCSYRE